jgi:tetratricopeptide (TPR) repeat protein
MASADMPDFAIAIWSFIKSLIDWAVENPVASGIVGAVLVALGKAIAWVWKNWIKRTDFDTIAKILAEQAEAKGRALATLEYQGHLAEKDQEISGLRAALEKAQSLSPTPLIGAAKGSAITPESAQALATASEKALQEYFLAKKAEGAKANREAAVAARHIGALAFLHDTQKALRFYREATELDPDDPEGWNELGHLLRRVGDLPGAEEAYSHVLRLGSSIADKGAVAVAYGNLGNIYLSRGDLGKAEEFYKKSLALNEQLGHKEGMANDYGNLGVLYSTRGDLVKAEGFYTKSLAIEEQLGRKEGMANDYGNLGNLYGKRGDKGKVCEYWAKSRRLYLELGNRTQADEIAGWMRKAGCPLESPAGDVGMTQK